MTYELAKQLKDAGFPQATGGFYYWNRDERCNETADTRPFYDDRIITHTIKAPTIKAPTLSELIEACNSKLFNVTRLDENNWVTNFDEDQNMDGTTQGPTPEEAVAKLWLALNKK